MSYEEILAAMRARYRALSGFDADSASDIGIRLKVLAVEAASLYERMDELRDQVFPQTSGGQFLDMHAEIRGLSRKPAAPARGLLRFSREIPALSDISIPAGVLCATRPSTQVRFETERDAVLPAGAYYVDIPAVAVDAGAVGNVAAGAVCVMVSPAAGISGVTNPGAFSGGVDEENDDALKGRLLAAYQNISNGTNRAFYYDLAMSNEGVSSANVLARRRGRGTVDVVVTCSLPSAQNEIVAAIQADMNARKEINVDVLVMAAVEDGLAASVEIEVKSGYSSAIVAEKAHAEIISRLNALGVGEPLLLAALGSGLLAVDGVYNYRILTPNKDILPASDHVIRPGTVSVSGMGAS